MNRDLNTQMQENKRAGSGREPVSHSVPLITIFGIEVRLDVSVLIIFFLIVFSLGNGIFPQWHPDWSPELIWGTAIVSGILFFVSLLAHELAHSVVSQRYGIPVPRITLFLFGGMAEPSREPDTPKIEFWVAIAGPLMSLLISIVCSNLALWLTNDPDLMAGIMSGDQEALSQIGPVSTSLLWLGSINLILAVFNMIPGFPMDGGRVFRAVIWGVTGDQMKATRWASNGGRYFGWTLMALGVLTFLGGGGFGGLWWILIGWFISSLATMSYQKLVTDRALRGFKVSDLMRTRFDHVEASVKLPVFIDHYLLRSTQQLWPVVEGDRVVGVISLSDVTDLSEDERSSKLIKDLIRPLLSQEYLELETSAGDAFQQLAAADDEPLPVIENGRIVGLIQRGDIIRWMSLHDI